MDEISLEGGEEVVDAFVDAVALAFAVCIERAVVVVLEVVGVNLPEAGWVQSCGGGMVLVEKERVGCKGVDMKQ